MAYPSAVSRPNEGRRPPRLRSLRGGKLLQRFGPVAKDAKWYASLEQRMSRMKMSGDDNYARRRVECRQRGTSAL